MKGVLKVSKEQVIDVRGKRFNTHGELHCMEMTISKDHVAGKSCRGRVKRPSLDGLASRTPD